MLSPKAASPNVTLCVYANERKEWAAANRQILGARTLRALESCHVADNSAPHLPRERTEDADLADVIRSPGPAFFELPLPRPRERPGQAPVIRASRFYQD
jgi:hypothetical protein